MPRQDFINPNFVTEAQLDAARRGSFGQPAVDVRDIISGKVDGRPIWHCGHSGCTFSAPLRSKEQEKHPGTHTRKLTADERKRAEADLANARAIYPTVIECGCGRMMKPGEPAHACNLVKETGPRSIDVSAAAFQREGLKQALRELEQD
jgi:hypothetical protein